MQNAEITRKDNTPLAVVVITLTVLALSLGDALIKFTSGEFVLWQIFVLRSLLVVPVLLVVLRLRAPDAFAIPPALGWTVLRSAMLVGMWIAYYMALPHLELSIAAAAYYTLPIFITLFSSLLIGDRISFSGWFAVMIGFLGVLLILRPNAEDFNFYALLPLISAVLYALAMILTRTKCQMVHPIILSIALNLSFIVVGTVAAVGILIIAPETRDGFMWGPWAEMGNAEWLSISLLAIAILIGSVGAAIAYQYGRPTIIGTFDFAYVGFAVLWGFIFFAEVPDLLSIAGILMIVVAGVLSLRQ